MIRLGTLRPLWLRLPGLLRPLRLALAVWSGHFLLRFRLRCYLYRRGSLYGRLHRSHLPMRRNGARATITIAPATLAFSVAAIAVSARPCFFFANFNAFHHPAINRFAQQLFDGVDRFLVVP